MAPEQKNQIETSSKDLTTDESNLDLNSRHRPKPRSNLKKSSIARFDELVRDDNLFYEPSSPERVVHDGFEFEFRIVTSFLRKPILAPDDPRRDHGTKSDPFTNPESAFLITDINGTHLLQLNKYSVYRPQYIVHPKAFAPQTDDLDESDFAAIWTLFEQVNLSDEPDQGEDQHVAFYNCGADAGSSQGHKHVQIIPKPPRAEHFLFPDHMFETGSPLSDTTPAAPPKEYNIPYEVRVLSFSGSPQNSSSSPSDSPSQSPTTAAQNAYKAHTTLLNWLHKSHSDTLNYDVIFTTRWICLIPRTHAGKDGINTNAMGMLGLCWVADDAEREGWNKLGLTKHLAFMGVGLNESKPEDQG